jgi:hypothetical protein
MMLLIVELPNKIPAALALFVMILFDITLHEVLKKYIPAVLVDSISAPLMVILFALPTRTP